MFVDGRVMKKNENHCIIRVMVGQRRFTAYWEKKKKFWFENRGITVGFSLIAFSINNRQSDVSIKFFLSSMNDIASFKEVISACSSKTAPRGEIVTQYLSRSSYYTVRVAEHKVTFARPRRGSRISSRHTTRNSNVHQHGPQWHVDSVQVSNFFFYSRRWAVHPHASLGRSFDRTLCLR